MQTLEQAECIMGNSNSKYGILKQFLILLTFLVGKGGSRIAATGLQGKRDRNGLQFD